MRKAKVVTNYARVKQNNLATEAQTIHDRLTGNAAYPNLPVTLVAFLAFITAYINKLAAALHGTPEQTAEKNVAKKDLLTAISKNGVYVNATADGDEVKLQSSGYIMAKVPQPKGPFGVPKLFVPQASREPGRALIEFAPQNGAAYIIRYTMEPKTERNQWPTTVETRRSFSVDGLVSGGRYTFIGAYKGASNELNYTAPVEVVIQ